MTDILLQLFKYAEDKLGFRNLLLMIALLCAAIYLLTWPKAEEETDPEADPEPEVDPEPTSDLKPENAGE